MSVQSANALASYSAQAAIKVSATSGTYAFGWTPTTAGTAGSFGIGGNLSSPTEVIGTNFGTTTHNYVSVNTVAPGTRVYGQQPVNRDVINSTRTLSGSANAGASGAAISTDLSQTWRTAMYFYNMNPNVLDAEFTASASLLLATTVGDLSKEGAFAAGTITAMISIDGGTPTILDVFDISASSLNGVGTGASSGDQAVAFTLPGKTVSFTHNAILTYVVDLEGSAVSNVPLPAALPMLGMALGGLGFVARRRAKKANA